MDLKLAGRVVFVGGGSRGIGLGIANACLAEGAKVALTARGVSGLLEAGRQLTERYGAGRVWTFSGDMRNTDEVETAMANCEDQLGSIWGAVANVGLHPCPTGLNVDDESWTGGIEQNLGSAFRLARGAMRRLMPQREGSIVLISSIAGLRAMGTPLTYGTAKAALNHLGRELARIAGPSGVRVNVLAPGNIIFPGGDWDARLNGPRAQAWKRWIDREVPLKRFYARRNWTGDGVLAQSGVQFSDWSRVGGRWSTEQLNCRAVCTAAASDLRAKNTAL